MNTTPASYPSIHVELPFDESMEITPSRKLTEVEFEVFCQNNPDLQVELEPDGTLFIMPPVHFDSGRFELRISSTILHYVDKNGKGQAFGPSTGFKLPDGSTRAPDAAWVSDEQIARLSPEDRNSFAPLVPEFVVEIRSDTDRLARLQQKMTGTWIANGVQLAWLIDPVERKAYVYRADGSIQVITDFATKLSGEDVLPGFEFDLGSLK